MKEIALRNANWIYQQHFQDVGPKKKSKPTQSDYNSFRKINKSLHLKKVALERVPNQDYNRIDFEIDSKNDAQKASYSKSFLFYVSIRKIQEPLFINTWYWFQNTTK